MWTWVVQAAPARSSPSSRLPYPQHVERLRKKLPRGFTVVVAPPFVVVGDEAPGRVQEHAEHTVRWAIRRLKKAYFPRDPAFIIDVWLFRDRESYERNARSLLGETPISPYGYYAASRRALIMNIATGGGTLVHEIVHPFVEANFPECPAWLNEGLGSLYEQCTERNGEIVGLPNWRLPGLQDAIRKGRTRSLSTIMAMDAATFYGDDSGLHYAEARYLCYYLQEQGLLRPFYHRLVARKAEDPTGVGTLREVLGRSELASFQRSWESYILTLRWP